jgi:ureidoglycolate hydrolase
MARCTAGFGAIIFCLSKTQEATVASTPSIQALKSQWITPEAFVPFGQVIFASPDDKSYDLSDAQLHLEQGIPRFYIMQLGNKGRHFTHITRHQRCTQCLGSLEGKDWFMAVAPPSVEPQPNWQVIAAFQIPGNCFIKLDRGTWHSGPYFDAEVVEFYNLELSDTNVNDHQTCNLAETYGIAFEIF